MKSDFIVWLDGSIEGFVCVLTADYFQGCVFVAFHAVLQRGSMSLPPSHSYTLIHTHTHSSACNW